MNKFYGNRENVFMIFIAVNLISICVAKPKYIDEAKIEESGVTRGGPAPSISSRFLDLGGVISQLFPGFNQGNRGRGPGVNLPPNSQFYPGVPAQSSHLQPPLNQGNEWSYNNQGFIPGNNGIGGIQNQQEWAQPNQNSVNSNNLQPIQNQGWPQQGQNFGQNLNSQNNNLNPQQNFQNQGSHTGRLTTVPQYPSQGTAVNDGQDPTLSRNEGTLEDFFPTENPTQFGDHDHVHDHKIIFPDDDESIVMTSKNAIWGKPVIVPSTTPADSIIFIDSTVAPSQKQCVQNCPTTSEYDPVCGTDNVSYFNAGRLICARNCGINVFEARRGSCRESG